MIAITQYSYIFRTGLLWLVLALVLVPLALLFSSWLSIDGAIWQHLVDTQLVRLVGNTLWLLSGVALLVLILGVSLAWLTAVCEFPGRRFFDVALILPLAVPSYVLAFVFLGIFDITGPVRQLPPGANFRRILCRLRKLANCSNRPSN